MESEVNDIEPMEETMTQNVNLPTTYTPPAPYQVQPAGPVNYFADIRTFEDGQRMCKLLAASDLVPQQFRGNVANTLIALEMANRTNSSPFQVMQNIYIVHGKPAWSATFIIAAINACGKYSPLRFQMEGEGDKLTCRAWAIEKETGERLEGPPVSIEMAKKEGWATKNGSKWATMPELMLRYRAATVFGRLYAPDILMGMRTSDELYDIEANNEMRRSAPVRRNEPAQIAEAVVVESDGSGPASVAEINAMLKAEAPAVEGAKAEAEAAPPCHSERESARNLQQEAGDSSEPAAPQNDGEGGAEPEKEKKESAEVPAEQAEAFTVSAMAFVEEIDGIDDAATLKAWCMKKGYQNLALALGGMDSQWYAQVMRHLRGRIETLEAAERKGK